MQVKIERKCFEPYLAFQDAHFQFMFCVISLKLTNCINGVASPTIWSCYANMSLFIGLWKQYIY